MSAANHIVIALDDPVDLEHWRIHARRLLQDEVPPQSVSWAVPGEDSLFAPQAVPSPACGGGSGWGLPDAESTLINKPRSSQPTPVPASFLPLAASVLCHSDPQRHGLLYHVLWRLTHGEKGLLQRSTDDDVLRLHAMQKNVSRDSHKMKAFVRFREVRRGEGEPPVFVAWFEPEQYIVERVAPFFVRRFAGMQWVILTPHRSAGWDGETLRFGSGATKADAPSEDALENLWRTYYAHIFNPARLKLKAMTSEMPVKYWKNLPEAQIIPTLIRDAHARRERMIASAATEPNPRMATALPPPKPSAD